MDYLIRPITQADNAAISKIIKEVMTSFECVGDGYSIEDPEVDQMYEYYKDARSMYYVVEHNNKVLGGCGIAALEGGDGTVCELKKMYYLPEARGKGLGKQMLVICLEKARELGYKACYLETVERMEVANKFYAAQGFTELTKQEGNTGHCGCDRFYKMAL